MDKQTIELLLNMARGQVMSARESFKYCTCETDFDDAKESRVKAEGAVEFLEMQLAEVKDH